MKINNLNKIKGFTLIEYMVAIIIGLILIAGISSFFLGMKSSAGSQKAISEVQEKARFALYYLTNDIQLAGWTDPTETKIVGRAVDDYIDITKSSDSANAKGSDQITLSYEADIDCLGNTVAATDKVTTHTYLVENGELKCSSQNKKEPLISGVESLHFVYGVDGNADGTPDEYLNATDLKVTPSKAEQVVSVQLSLVIASEQNVSDTEKSQEFTISDAGTYTSDKDKKLRKLFSTTIYIPNRSKTVGGK